jgi:hypothetical protein
MLHASVTLGSGAQDLNARRGQTVTITPAKMATPLPQTIAFANATLASGGTDTAAQQMPLPVISTTLNTGNQLHHQPQLIEFVLRGPLATQKRLRWPVPQVEVLALAHSLQIATATAARSAQLWLHLWAQQKWQTVLWLMAAPSQLPSIEYANAAKATSAQALNALPGKLVVSMRRRLCPVHRHRIVRANALTDFGLKTVVPTAIVWRGRLASTRSIGSC